MKPLLLPLLFLSLCGCVGISGKATYSEALGADQLYARRVALSEKVVRANFVWHYGFETCTVYVPAEGGGLHFLAIDFDAESVKRASPREWAIVQKVWHDFQAAFFSAVKDGRGTDSLPRFTMRVDADVKVLLSENDLRRDVIVVGRDLVLKVMSIHSIRSEEG